MVRHRSHDQEAYELTENLSNRHPDDFAYSSSFEDDGARAGLLTEQQVASHKSSSLIASLTNFVPYLRRRRGSLQFVSKSTKRRSCLRPSSLRRIVALVSGVIAITIFLVAILFPSYTNPPPHYTVLRNRAQSSNAPGRANPASQKVYIAASIYDRGGKLANGAWAESVLGLIDVLGPENVYLSIYENDAGQEAETALDNLKKSITCDHNIRFDKHLSLDEVAHIELPDGSKRVKRIEYLSEVRNRALQPLRDSSIQYDKMLYINDVIFDPIEAAQLLFSTNLDFAGNANYRAACALDFLNPVKYYDTFATRDYEGYGIGLPFYPWFTTAGQGVSRQDVFAGSDAVRVKSCWGGMVAFDARFFQAKSSAASVPSTAGSEGPKNMTAPYQFRAEEDLYWDASECCLIHADIRNSDPTEAGIVMNPYVRVAYDKRTLSWLSSIRRLERLLSPIHYILTKAVGMPWYNPRRNEQPGEKVKERVWVPDHTADNGGSFQTIDRTASHSGYCGRRALQVLKTDITEGEKNWEFLPVPD